MKDLKEIQIEIKKELGGVSLNHLIAYMSQAENKSGKRKFILFVYTSRKSGTIKIKLEPLNMTEVAFVDYYALINQQNQALNILGQSEEFQRNLYDAIQIIKNINNK
jgi:hypothetical protein